MILFIDACVRENSRTRRLAMRLLSKFNEAPVTLKLSETALPRLDDNTQAERSALCKAGDYSDPRFNFAKQFAAADTIVIAAPYWDFSFPALLKEYIEAICCSGLTFRYSEEGYPIGLCRAKTLYYVTTCGGALYHPECGFGYIKSLVTEMMGVKECVLIKAEGLDVIGNDVEEILKKAEEIIDKM